MCHPYFPYRLCTISDSATILFQPLQVGAPEGESVDNTTCPLLPRPTVSFKSSQREYGCSIKFVFPQK